MFFKKKSEDDSEVEEIIYSFYIPIVEQFKANDFISGRAWHYAQTPNVIRKIYISQDLLIKSEAARLPPGATLSCYKVSLSSEQFEKIKTTDIYGVLKAYISITPLQIEHLTSFNKDGIRVELNPSFEPALTKTSAANNLV